MGRRTIDNAREEVRDMDTLTEEECWELLGSATVARLAIAVAGEVEIFPISIVVDGRAVVFRSAEGTKLAASVIAGRVALEVDEVDAESGVAWSVVLKGDTELVEHLDDIRHVETLPLPRWHPQYLGRFVRVRPRDVQGRRVSRVDTDDDS
jgi:nitroimidazol reductase NimA-like FMN-containing flavoprotein (pyridoxamine 5'-phosphate oxidase superfamily)